MDENDVIQEEEVVQTALPDPGYYQFYRNLDSRRVILNSRCDDTLISIANMILLWNEEDLGKNREDRVPIKIMINTMGGDISAAMHLSDMIEASTTPVYTIGLANIYSAGACIFLSGHKRLIFKNTTMLIHDGTFTVGESAGKFCDTAKFLEQQNDRINFFICEHSNIDMETLQKKYRYDWFMFAEDIMKYGCADEVISSIDEVL